MSLTALSPEQRNLLFFTTPILWPHWPYLPLVRRNPDAEPELGILYDAVGVSGRTGFAATVFVTNLYQIPANEAELLALPKEVFDMPEEIAAAGWNVD